MLTRSFAALFMLALLFIPLVKPAYSQTSGTDDASRVESLKKTVKKIGTGEKAKVKVTLADGSHVYGKNFISNMHPVRTLDMTESNLIKAAYKHRVKSLENSIGGFVVNIVFEKKADPLFKKNFYFSRKGQEWNFNVYNDET